MPEEPSLRTGPFEIFCGPTRSRCMFDTNWSAPHRVPHVSFVLLLFTTRDSRSFIIWDRLFVVSTMAVATFFLPSSHFSPQRCQYVSLQPISKNKFIKEGPLKKREHPKVCTMRSIYSQVYNISPHGPNVVYRVSFGCVTLIF